MRMLKCAAVLAATNLAVLAWTSGSEAAGRYGRDGYAPVVSTPSAYGTRRYRKRRYRHKPSFSYQVNLRRRGGARQFFDLLEEEAG